MTCGSEAWDHIEGQAKQAEINAHAWVVLLDVVLFHQT
jgi:hypothetical protein